MRKNYRKRKFNRKRKSTYKVFFLILVAMTVGFAAINTTLQLIGTLNISRTTWNIHWENPTKVGGVTAIQEVHLKSGDDTTVEYQVKLNNPGDYYEFTVDAKNDGTIDGMITSISNKVYENNVEVTPTYLESTITYDDGTSIENNHLLESGKKETYKVKVQYKTGLYADQLPDSEKTYNYRFTVTYMQADNNAKYVREKDYEGRIVYYDPINISTCDDTTYDEQAVKNNTSTCYKWRILNKENKNMTIQLDHNIVNQVAWNSSSTNVAGPVNALSAIANSTSNWTRIPALNYEYDTTQANSNYGILRCEDGICKKDINGTLTLIAGTTAKPLRARIITGEEIKRITIDTGISTSALAYNWTVSSSYNDYYYFSNTQYTTGTKTRGEGNLDLSWLVENTRVIADSGATSFGIDNDGYWSLTPVSDYSRRAWYVNRDGVIYPGWIDAANSPGVRPIITLPECALNKNKCTGWNLINENMQKWSYYQSNGEIIESGWGRQIPDLSGSPRDYYFENGVPIKGWRVIDGNKYYFSEDDTDHNNYIDYNKVYGGTYNIDGENYTFDNDGVCISANCNE